MKRSSLSAVCGACALGLAVALAPAAHAQTPPACSSLSNVVYMQVGDTQEPLMKQLGAKLRANTAFPVTIAYALNGSCTNIDALYNGTKLTVNPTYIPSTTEDPAWDPSKPSPSCTIDTVAGVDLSLYAPLSPATVTTTA